MDIFSRYLRKFKIYRLERDILDLDRTIILLDKIRRNKSKKLQILMET